ncbi:hypothetical protein Ae201684P_021505 [Aphanomyces euteiches]|nr:hypothetical protein Ae201684P_021505 [Aphanomyces euteiches]
MAASLVDAALLAAFPADSLSKLSELKHLGVCVRCIMRYSGITDHEAYCLDTTTLQATWEKFAQESSEPSQKEVCTCCLDVFEIALGNTGREKLVTMVRESGYLTSTFMIAIKLPSATLIRQHSLSHHLQHQGTPVDLKEVLKWCLTPILAEALGNATYVATSDMSVLLHFQHELSEQEAMQLPTIRDTIVQNKKRKLDIDAFGACPPPKVSASSTLNCTIERAPIYLAGRYLKYERGLSQTPWVVEGERLGESSVEEAIGDIVLPHFHAKSFKFHTAGREDVDVRMLGNGRPFILELLGLNFPFISAIKRIRIDAKLATLPTEDFKRIQEEVNTKNDQRVEIREFTSTTKEMFAELQSGADSKKKTYCCVVWVADKLTPERVAILDSISDLEVAQKTPVRVLHRRTLLTRPKVIHNAKCQVLNDHYMLLRLTTSAGTYVKEFVHGDLGRTSPNVSSLLGCDADILQLDVENLIE